MKAVYRGIRYHECEILLNDQISLTDGPIIPLNDQDLILNPTDSQWFDAQEGEPAWVYNETDVKALPPGLYLGLFHGRNHPHEQLDDWGHNGPIIGPLFYVHTTYAHHLKLRFTSPEAHNRYFRAEPASWQPGKGVAPDKILTWRQENEFVLHDDLLEYKGKFYGDWSVFIAPDCAL